MPPLLSFSALYCDFMLIFLAELCLLEADRIPKPLVHHRSCLTVVFVVGTADYNVSPGNIGSAKLVPICRGLQDVTEQVARHMA
jgi:hypothetical protein